MLRDRRTFRRQQALGLCVNCNYDLNGAEDGMCSECGSLQPTPAEQPAEG